MSPAQQPGAESGSMVFDGSSGSVLQGRSQTMTLDDSFIGGIDTSPIIKQPATDAGSSTRSVAKPTTSGLRGSRLIAEYRPMTDKYFYYTADQINSTRVVTDDSGNVVYSATYSPFGKKIQSSQSIDDSPKPQFSNKEREQTTNLDYFGARYYDHATYRFNSTDPIINKKEAIANPQLWNLYTYCRNNPVSFLDPDGRFDLRHPGDKELERMDGPPSKWPSINTLDRVSNSFSRMMKTPSIPSINISIPKLTKIFKVGGAAQGSFYGMTLRIEGYLYISDDRIGAGVTYGGGFTSQTKGISGTGFIGIAEKEYKKSASVVSSFAVNLGIRRIGGAGIDLGDDGFDGFSIEYGYTRSELPIETSATLMWDRRWEKTF